MTCRGTWSYIIGVALGDGNLSNPNGRAIRLRITCDAKYPKLAQYIVDSLRYVLPRNAVSLVYVPGVRTYFNISVYSNELANWMPWKVGCGTKESQQAHVPSWIRENEEFSKACLRGLLQTDGSIYHDRGYLMVNFCNNTEQLACDVHEMLCALGHSPTITSTPAKYATKYTVRVAKNAEELINDIQLFKE